MIENIFAILKSSFYRIFLRKTLFLNKYIESIPENLSPGILYIEGFQGNHWFATLLCPCGCKQEININLDKNDSPCWEIRNTRFSDLWPSIWKKNGCKSHFFLKNGFIFWC